MASTNQSPQYQKAEAAFLASKSNDDKLYWLDEMIKHCPKHKSAEKMLANLKTRRKKLLEKAEAQKKAGHKSGKPGIKKEDMQAVIVGLTNSGKSTLLDLLTGTSPKVAPYDFTTRVPVIGMMPFSGTKTQLIEVPAFGSEFYDKGLVNGADLILVLVTSIEQIDKILPELDKSIGKKVIIFNTKDDLDLRKIEASLSSKKFNFHILDFKNKENLNQLKEKIFQNFDKIRIYTKEPNKEKSDKPLILEIGSTIKDVAKKIIKNLSDIKETKIWGPSSKFPGQVVGLSHILKDLDIVEFKTR